MGWRGRGRWGRFQTQGPRKSVPSSSPPFIFTPPLMDLFTWLSTHSSFYLGPIAPQIFPASGRGIGATRDLLPGELLLRIPSSAILTNDTSLGILKPYFTSTPTGPALYDILSNDDTLAIATLLYKESLDPASPFRAYLASLPTSEDLHTVVGAGGWSGEELGWFRDSALVQQAETRASEVRACFAAMEACGLGVGGGGSGGGLSTFTWCVASVTSRVFLSGLGVDPMFAGGGGGGLLGMLDLALVPGGDLFNHTSAPGALTMDTEWVGECYEVRCPAQQKQQQQQQQPECVVRKGEEVYISYGDRPARDLVENYGFLPPPPLQDSLTLGVGALFCVPPPASSLSTWLALQLRTVVGGGGGGGGTEAAGSYFSLSSSTTPAATPPPPPTLLPFRTRALLAEEGSGLSVEALELELPYTTGERVSVLPGDAGRLLRTLCLTKEDCGGGEGGGGNAQGSTATTNTLPPHKLEGPVSRDNEVRVHALLCALLTGLVVQEYSCGGGGGGGGGTIQQEPSTFLVGKDGVPVLNTLTASRLEGLYGAALSALEGGGDGSRGEGATTTTTTTPLTRGKVLTRFAEACLHSCDALVEVLEALVGLEEGGGGGSGKGEGPTSSSPARFQLASKYRTFRAHTLLAYAQYVQGMMRRASGGGGGKGT